MSLEGVYFYYNLLEPFENSVMAHKKSSRLEHKFVPSC